MKKIAFYTLLSLLTLSLCACSSSDDEPQQSEQEQQPEEEVNEVLDYWKQEANNSTVAFVKHFWNKDKKFFNT